MKSEVRFNKELYRASAVETAREEFSQFGTLAVTEDDTHLVVTIESPSDEVARQIQLELSNMVLGLTMERGGAPGAQSATG